MHDLVWRLKAEQDLHAIINWIGRDSPQRALSFAKELQSKALRLRENPKGDLAAWEVFLKLVNSMKNPQDKANADEHKPVNLLIPKPSIGEKNMRFFCAIFIKAALEVSNKF